MSEPTSTAAEQHDGSRGLIAALVLLAALACVVLLLWVINSAQQDPYVKATLELQGDPDHGGQLFRINCAGCHGLAGQGLLAPQLVGSQPEDARSQPDPSNCEWRNTPHAKLSNGSRSHGGSSESSSSAELIDRRRPGRACWSTERGQCRQALCKLRRGSASPGESTV